jgi:hypothetical protein
MPIKLGLMPVGKMFFPGSIRLESVSLNLKRNRTTRFFNPPTDLRRIEKMSLILKVKNLI